MEAGFSNPLQHSLTFGILCLSLKQTTFALHMEGGWRTGAKKQIRTWEPWFHLRCYQTAGLFLPEQPSEENAGRLDCLGVAWLPQVSAAISSGLFVLFNGLCLLQEISAAASVSWAASLDGCLRASTILYTGQSSLGTCPLALAVNSRKLWTNMIERFLGVRQNRNTQGLLETCTET
jgi:hypothetical protein